MATFPEAPDLPVGSQAWRRKIEKTISDLANSLDRVERNSKEISRSQSAGMRALATQFEQTRIEINDGIQSGRAPDTLSVTPYLYFAADGSVRGAVTVAWSYSDEDAFDLNGGAAYFEVWLRATRPEPDFPEDDGQPVPATPDMDSQRKESKASSPVDLTGLAVDTQYAVKVRPVSTSGVPGDYTDEAIFITPAGPEPLASPAAPGLSTSLGTVTIAWDGKLGGQIPPTYLRDVLVERSPHGANTWTQIGSALGGSCVDADVEIGTEYDYRLVPQDSVRLLGTPGPLSSIVVKGVSLPDVDQTITDAIDEAMATATGAAAVAEGAVQDALTAQEAADDANTAALAAAGIADSKGKVLYGTTAPGVADRNSVTLWIDTTGGANTPKRWNGTAWVAVTDKAATDAAAAAATADAKAVAAQTAASNAAAAASAAQGTANTAVSNAAAAQTAADAANSAAAAAAGIAGGKADVLIQSTAPAADMRKSTTLWIDTTGGANTPKRWVSGTTWAAVTDKAATDAAAAAAAAAATAASALAAAGAAQSTADSAVASASGRNAMYHATTAPSGTGTRSGDIWHQWSTMNTNGQLLGTWRWSGSAWVPTQLSESYLPLVNIGSGTYGLLKGDRLEANTITADKLLVGDITNHLPGGGFDSESDRLAWDIVGDGWIATGTGNAYYSSGGLFVTSTGVVPRGYRKTIEVQAGQEWLIQWVDQTTSAYNGTPSNGKLRLGDQDGALLTAYAWGEPHGWQQKSYVYTIPSGVTQLSVTLSFDHTAGTVKIDNLQLRLRNAGELIVDGAITTGKLAANAVTANELAADAVTANKIAGGAIDGKVITGATIQTTATANRGVTLNSSGIHGWNSSGVEVFTVDTAGLATITGGTIRTAATGQRIQLDTAGLKSYNSSNAVTGQLSASSGGLQLSGKIRSGSGNQRVEMSSLGLDFFNSAGTAAGSIRGDVALGSPVVSVIGKLNTTGTLNVVGGEAHFGQTSFGEFEILTDVYGAYLTPYAGSGVSTPDLRLGGRLVLTAQTYNRTFSGVGTGGYGLLAVNQDTGDVGRATGALSVAYIPHISTTTSRVHLGVDAANPTSGTYFGLDNTGTNAYAAWISHGGTNRFLITNDGIIRATGIYGNDITTTRRSTWMSSAGDIGWASSSRTKKQDLGPAALDPDALRQIPVHHYHYLAELEKQKEDPDYHVATEIGTFAEDVHELGLWQFVQYGGHGEDAVPVGIHYDMLALAALSLAQNLADRLDALEATH